MSNLLTLSLALLLVYWLFLNPDLTKFSQTSAKNRINISEPYIELVRQIDHWVQAKQREKDATSQKKQKKPSSGRRCIIL